MEQIVNLVKQHPYETGIVIAAILLTITGKWQAAIDLLKSAFFAVKSALAPDQPMAAASVPANTEADLDYLLGMFKRELLAGDHAAQKVTLAKIQALCPCEEHKPAVEQIKP